MANPKKKVLVAPLDWGLGHATRCIPIIKELMSQDVEVLVAADGRPFDHLKKEFPFLTFMRLPGYSVAYSDDKRIALKVVQQFPQLIFSAMSEHRMLGRIIREFGVQGVISDSRFGLFARGIPCVYVSHQIGIKMPPRLEWASYPVYLINKSLINQYSECWIPDNGGEDNLSGELSHHYPTPRNAKYIGPLSRFKKMTGIVKEYDVLVLLSGPEPQRSILESIVLEQLKASTYRSLVVRGVPEKNQRIKLSELLTVVSSLESEALNVAILSSDIVLSRPGYSTVMDLALLGNRAIFIPTPGQTEQEYLAEIFLKKGTFCIRRQELFNLEEAIKEARQRPGISSNGSPRARLRDVIQEFVARIPEAR